MLTPKCQCEDRNGGQQELMLKAMVTLILFLVVEIHTQTRTFVDEHVFLSI